MKECLTIDESQELFDLGLPQSLATGEENGRPVFTLQDIGGIIPRVITVSVFTIKDYGTSRASSSETEVQYYLEAGEELEDYCYYEQFSSSPRQIAYGYAMYRNADLDSILVRYQCSTLRDALFKLTKWAAKHKYIKY